MPQSPRPGAPALAGALLALTALAGCASGTAAPTPPASPAPVPSTTSPASADPAARSPATTTPATASRTPATATAGSPAETATTAATTEVVVRVSGDTVEPRPAAVEVAQGATVRLRVTSDTADELHVHGYEKTLALPAGREAALSFRADQTGRFAVETHESGKTLVTLLVR